MRQPQLSALSVLSLTAVLALAGCASKPAVDQTVGWSPNRIYSEAKDEARSANYDKAVELYERLEGRAAGTPLAQQAELEKAYTQYRGGDKASAIASLDRFIKLHPASPAVDYALYLKGIVNFNDDLGLFSFVSRQDLSERDQRAAKESFEAFKELATRFPDSRYTPDATERMRYIINALAQYEVHVARYYFSRGAYVAAINRAQVAITDYQDAPALEEALEILVKSYDALGMEQLRDDTRRVLEKTYPNSTVLTKGMQRDSGPWWKVW
ncbi:outer membrane protein assembly factor BamD [Comamonas serinivorans]|uniref:Outer membrane protein assembly factor BamD n=1 Tax=Comamonas serinivorans TaxID=1082851 RepID=A0A1Y0ENM2_9BURK|nr:outer membrane protein assembly factor BamD [Comamonas serinivorans]ARU05233.1 outer membrane protein assembly factor BamD [Comamonas serinivorans]